MLVRHLQIQPTVCLIWLVGWLNPQTQNPGYARQFHYAISCEGHKHLWILVSLGIPRNQGRGNTSVLGTDTPQIQKDDWQSLKDEPRKGNPRISENQLNLCIDSKVRINTVETHKRLSDYSRPSVFLGDWIQTHQGYQNPWVQKSHSCSPYPWILPPQIWWLTVYLLKKFACK